MRGYKLIKKILAVTAIMLFLETATLQSIGGENGSTNITSGVYGKGYRYNIQGWVYIHIEGEPYERGYQYGYLAAAEIVDLMHRWSNFGQNDNFMKIFIFKKLRNDYDELSETYWNLCKERGMKFFWDQYPKEYQEEIKGIAAGIRDRGGIIHGRPVEYQDVFTLNVIEETRETFGNPGGRGRPFKAFFDQLKSLLKGIFNKQPQEDDKNLGYCMAFMATGDATTDGRLIASHSLVIANYMAQRTNMILDVQPSKGHRFVMTVFPGYIWSSQDFLENEVGVTLMETVIWPPFGPWDVKGTTPVGVRVRKAIQYSDSIDDVIQTFLDGNNGLYPCDWLIGDTKTGEIASLELGFYNHAITRTKNGYLWSCCNIKNNKVRWEQWSIFGLGIIGRFIPYFNKYRPSEIDKKFMELGDKYYGKIDTETVKEIMSTYEICHIVTDCKITDSELIKDLGLWAHLGRPDGSPYKPDAIAEQKYHGVKENPGTGWLKLYASKSEPATLPTIKSSNIAQKESRVVWSYQTENRGNRDYSLSAISGDTLFAAATSSKIYALDKGNGRLLWEHDIGEKTVEPSVSEDLVFTGADRGLMAIDKETGTIKWEKQIQDISSKPVVTEDLVIAGCSNGEVYAFDIDTGETKWRCKLDSSAKLSEVSGNILFMNSGHSCQAFDIENEEKLWEYNTKGIITKSSIIDGKTVYFGSWDGNLYAIDSKTGDLKWLFKTGWGINTVPAVKKDTIFFGSTDNNFYALDKNTGELKWNFLCKAAIQSSPTVYGEYVFFGCDDGRLYALDKTDGKLAWTFAPEFTVNDDIYNYVTTPILSNPVVENGVVYIDVKGTVYALDAQTFETIEEPSIEEPNNEIISLVAAISVALLIILLIFRGIKKKKKGKNK